MLLPDTLLDEWIIAISLMFIAVGVIVTGLWKVFKAIKRVESVLGIDDSGRTIPERVTAVEDTQVIHSSDIAYLKGLAG